MKKKWDQRVYLDLYSGSGRARIEGTSRIVSTSAVRALEISDPFDLYVFCEKDPGLGEALRARVTRDHPGANAKFVLGDVNEKVTEILASFRAPSRHNRVLAFCFADLSSSTISSSRRYVSWRLGTSIF